MPWFNPADPQLQRQLRAADPERLVELLAHLCVTDRWIAQRVEAILLANDSSALAAALQKRIANIAPDDYVDYKAAGGYANRLEAILDDIGTLLLPRDPQAALRLTADFIASDSKVFENMDDSCNQAGAVFERAAELFTLAATELNDSILSQKLLSELLQKDDYGVRDFLRNPRAQPGT